MLKLTTEIAQKIPRLQPRQKLLQQCVNQHCQLCLVTSHLVFTHASLDHERSCLLMTTSHSNIYEVSARVIWSISTAG